MGVQSTNQEGSKKRIWPTILCAVLWLLLLVAVGAAIWFDVAKEPTPTSKEITSIMTNIRDIETVCGKLPSDNDKSDCQAKIKRVSDVVAEQSLIEQTKRIDLRKRIWLIFLSLVIGLPILLAAAQTFRKTSEDSKPVWIVICCVIILLLVMVVVSIAVWNRPDSYIAYVPVPILEWGFAGGMLAVIYRLAFGRDSSVRRLRRLPRWVVARPIIGLFMSAVIYFIVLTEGILTNAKLENGQLPNYLWLNAIAFIAAFSDTFSEAVIRRVTSTLAPEHREKASDKKEGSEDSR